MKSLTSILTACAIAASVEHAYAQSMPVTGIVVDDRTAQPLAEVLVHVEDHPFFAKSGSDGRFTLTLPPGTYAVVASLIGYAVTRQSVVVGTGEAEPITIRLPEGAGSYAERLTVSGKASAEADAAPGGSALHGRELQDLRGLMLDDPLRAVQALPSVTATDDFYSEFAVRGSSFRHVGLAIDGIPSRYLMHTIHGVTDGGSIAMVNSEALGAVSLLPGSYPQRVGRRLGAQLELSSREGSRDGFHGRAGLSGTSATFLGEGPLAGGRGSWLASVRRSYLDLLIKQIDDDGSFAFGFTDVLAKVVVDVTPQHQIQALTIAGRSDFEEGQEGLGANDEAHANGLAWLSALTWRYSPGARFSLSQRAYATGVDFTNRNAAAVALDAGRRVDLGWRADGSVAAAAGWLVEFGGEAQRLSGGHRQQRTLDGAAAPTVLAEYDERGSAASAYGLMKIGLSSRLTVAPGTRVDYWGLTRQTTWSPWVTGELSLAEGTRLRAGGGVYRQFPEFDQLFGIRGGGTTLRPERAVHTDLALEQTLMRSTTLKVAWYNRHEEDVLWTRGGEPRRLPDQTIRAGRGDAPWINALDGRARGVELVLRRDAPRGLSGWAGYAYGRHRYTDSSTGETFWADADQRHTISVYGRYPVSNRTSLSAKFRYGSNYPITGYIREQPFAPDAPPLFGGMRPLFYGLGEERNTLRLPPYARIDVRADRAFNWSGRRLTLFVEVANASNHTNLRSTPYGFDPSGRVVGATETLMPIVPSAGFVVEF